MISFVARRTLRSLAALVVVSFATFSMVYANGNGIARNVLGGAFSQPTDAQVHAEMLKLGLERPLFDQYWTWASHAATGNLGQSFFTGIPVTNTLANRVPVTLFIIGFTLLLTMVISVLLGVAAGVYGGRIDKFVQFLSVIGGAIPSFVIAIALIFALAVDVRIFPACGYVAPAQDPGKWALAITLPIVTLLVGSVGGATSQFRGAVVDTLGQDYVRTLRARGISERAVILRHVLRNAAGPGLTVLALQTLAMLGGVVVIEQVFDLPGLGQLITNSAQGGDVPVIMGCVLITIVFVLVVNLIGDLAQGFLTPKAR
jgi:peptide/nickel transport system permease protein